MGLESLIDLPAVHEIMQRISSELLELTPSGIKEAARKGILWAAEDIALIALIGNRTDELWA